MSIQTGACTTDTAIVPSPLVGEGQGGGDGRTIEVGSPPAPNPSPRHGEAMLRMDGGGGQVELGEGA